MILIDSNVLIDVLQFAPDRYASSRRAIDDAVAAGAAYGPVVYAELAVGIGDRAFLDRALDDLFLSAAPMDEEAFFMAGRAHAAYRARGGPRTTILPDFFVGAHATVLGAALLTRDPRRYRTAFPQLALIEP